MPGNNFDFLRLCFALFVIITHSYPITGVSEEKDLLHVLTNGALAFSSLGVSGFFIISGYLISKSLDRSRSLGDYFTKRFLRIYPGLLGVLVLTVILGCFITTLPLIKYITNLDALSYVVQNLALVNMKHSINGVFEKNVLPGLINGSLWTIQYEMLFYILLSFLFVFRQHKKLTLAILLSAFAVVLVGHLLYTGRYARFYSGVTIPLTSFNVWGLAHFGLYFASGAILSSLNIEHFKYKKQLVIAALALTVGMMYMGWYEGKTSYILLPLVVIISGLYATKGLVGINKRVGGDLSYGIYLYGFLVQQTLMYYFDLNALELMVLSIPLALGCGYLSWNLVEKHPLKLKQRYAKASLLERAV